MKWLIKTKQVTIEDVYKIKPPPSLKCKPQITARKCILLMSYNDSKIYKSLHSQLQLVPDKSSSDGIHAITSSGAASRFVSCNVCGKDIVGSRFAPHLERCMNGGSRTTTGGFDLLPDTVKEKVKKEPVDPHPTSMVIRIKMRNGGRLSCIAFLLTLLLIKLPFDF
ncbi:hypothetical protein EON65_09885 [archaeon]|nr:MAG: hypothetical protein EON65_09885 [archaeon]